jgi:hypothetical protein
VIVVGPGDVSKLRPRAVSHSSAEGSRLSATILDMAASPTTRVEIDTDLLDRLRKRRPERNDRELLESAARIQLGREAIACVRKRFAGVPMEEIEREAVKAVHEARRERAAG